MNTNRVLLVLVWALLCFTISIPKGFTADPIGASRTEQKAAKLEATQKAELIDINTATKEQLQNIPGIGDVYAQKIIDGRPYAKKDQLKWRKILPDSLYEKVKDRIIAKQPPKKK